MTSVPEPPEEAHGRGAVEFPPGGAEEPAESALRRRLESEPNDVEAFDALADLIRRGSPRTGQGAPHARGDNAVRALAEQLAHSPRAWYPLLELARVVVHDEPEVAVRQLSTAVTRETSGRALAQAVRILREAGHEGDALGLGVGHWHPHEHDLDVARELVRTALQSGRRADAERWLDAISGHPDQARGAALRRELTPLVAGRRPFDSFRTRGVGVVIATGELDVGSVEGLRAAAVGVRDPDSPLVLDLEEVSFLDSVALGQMIALHKDVSAHGHGPLHVVATTPAVRQVLELSGGTRLFDVRDDLASAVAAAVVTGGGGGREQQTGSGRSGSGQSGPAGPGTQGRG
ncbi:MAG: STAS domain-containing protein [Kineosporiaceae bacterium]